MLKLILRCLVRILYGFTAHNESVLRTPGPVLLLANHVSWWDWIFIGICLEDDWRFVTSNVTAQLSWVHRKIMINRRTFPVEMVTLPSVEAAAVAAATRATTPMSKVIRKVIRKALLPSPALARMTRKA